MGTKRREITFDLGAHIVTTKRFEDLTKQELVDAAKARLDDILHDDAGVEAFGFVDEEFIECECNCDEHRACDRHAYGDDTGGAK